MLRLVSLNVEMDRHIGRFVPFLSAEAPDAALLQEVPEPYVADLAAKLGFAHHVFAPLAEVAAPESGRTFVMGQALLARTEPTHVQRLVYGGGGTGRTALDTESSESRWATAQYVLLAADLDVHGAAFRVATTHFPWSAGGTADDVQRRALPRFKEAARSLGDCVIAGDFNAPRGGEIFTALAAHFQDNIPVHYETSLDGALHRAGPLPYMVDGLFTTPGYHASDVALVSGVSDHMAIRACVARSTG